MTYQSASNQGNTQFCCLFCVNSVASCHIVAPPETFWYLRGYGGLNEMESTMSDRFVSLTDETAQRLSDAILRRRVELGIRSARSLGEETGLDYRTITSLEGARRDQVSRTTLAVLEMHLQWPAGYLSALLKQEGWRKTIELQVPSNADERDIESARRIAQASFDAALRSMG